jgi:hypothetical protein
MGSVMANVEWDGKSRLAKAVFKVINGDELKT